MNVDPAARLLGIVHEVNGIIEATLDVLSDVVFQMEAEVLHSLVHMVVSTVVCRTVNHVSNLVVFQQPVVLGNDITAQVHKIIQGHGAHPIKK